MTNRRLQLHTFQCTLFDFRLFTLATVLGMYVCQSGDAQESSPTLFGPPSPAALKLAFGIEKDPKADLPERPTFLTGERKDTLQKVLTERGIRARVAKISVPKLLAAEADLPKNADGTMNLDLNLFPDVSVTARLRQVDAPSEGTNAWVGNLADDPMSFVSVVARNDLVMEGDMLTRKRTTFANVLSPRHGTFEVRPLAETDYSLIREVDFSRMPSCGVEARHAVEFDAADVPPPVSPDDSTTTFDALVLYTPAVRIAEGGESAVRTLIDTAIVETNEAYVQSKIRAQLNLAHATEVDYDEKPTDTFDDLLTRLAETSDGHMDAAHQLRDQHKADLVVLLVNNDDYCGLASLMRTNSPAFRNHAFSVVHSGCATGYFSFGHELGHNMGCCHDVEHHSGGSLFPYAFGWHFETEGNMYRSIMAYAPGLRMKWFSNPDVKYKGVATGKANEADNARTINETRGTVSSFR